MENAGQHAITLGFFDPPVVLNPGDAVTFKPEDVGKGMPVTVSLTGWRYWWARFLGKPTTRTVQTRVVAVCSAD